MIECICINNYGRPEEIPVSRWPVFGKEYHIIHIFMHHLQGVRGVHLHEIKLGPESFPYETYKLSRFGMTMENLQKLIELAQACTDLDKVDIEKLLEESQLEIIDK